MKILYIAKHDNGGNDDEGAITHALRELGHTVHPLREVKGKLWKNLPRCDFLLFHKWDDWDTIRRVDLPRVFWYFDLVEYPDDPSLDKRCATRRRWMEQALPLVDLGFCTDGDWVRKYNAHTPNSRGHLVQLMQGADERVMGLGQPRKCPTCAQGWKGVDILFTGTRVGDERNKHLDEICQRYKDRFLIVNGIHQRALADLIASSQVVVAPDSPVTDRYFSNRVYNTLGFGGFLLHPYSTLLASHYTHNKHLVLYNGLDDFFCKLESCLGYPSFREEVRHAGLAHTRANHTYRHRCEELIFKVKERLKL